MQGSVKQNWLPGQPRVAHLFLISFINTDGTCTCSHVIPLYHKPIAGKDGELEQLLAVSLLPAAGIWYVALIVWQSAICLRRRQLAIARSWAWGCCNLNSSTTFWAVSGLRSSWLMDVSLVNNARGMAVAHSVAGTGRNAPASWAPPVAAHISATALRRGFFQNCADCK